MVVVSASPALMPPWQRRALATTACCGCQCRGAALASTRSNGLTIFYFSICLFVYFNLVDFSPPFASSGAHCSCAGVQNLNRFSLQRIIQLVININFEHVAICASACTVACAVPSACLRACQLSFSCGLVRARFFRGVQAELARDDTFVSTRRATRVVATQT